MTAAQDPQQDFIPSYVGLREDIISLIDPAMRGAVVLDVGCATGTTGKYLLDRGTAGIVYGIEYDPAMAREAEERYAAVLVGDAEQMDFTETFEPATFDYLIFGDILEHLREPEVLLQRLVPFLKVGGRVIISVPNMQHVSALWQLGVKGYWPDNDRGIFDRTHLRVITRKNLVEMTESAGLTTVRIKRMFRYRDRLGSEFPVYGRLLKWALPDYYTFQYLLLATRLE